MYAIMGSALTAVGLLALALLALLFRNPAAPAWSRSELVAELFAVVVTGALGLGFAYLAMAPMQLSADGLSLVEVAIAIGVFAGLVVVLRLLEVRTRLRAYDAARRCRGGAEPRGRQSRADAAAQSTAALGPAAPQGRLSAPAGPPWLKWPCQRSDDGGADNVVCPPPALLCESRYVIYGAQRIRGRRNGAQSFIKREMPLIRAAL